MIRKIDAKDLLPGMYVVDLHLPWFRHTFWSSRFVVRDPAHIRAIQADGITEVSIDTSRGPDVQTDRGPRIAQNVERTLSAMRQRPGARPRTVSLGEERRRAARLLHEAGDTMRELMSAACLGQGVETGRLEPMVQRMIESVLRNPDALAPLARLKQLDGYAAEHAVATAALIIALGHQQGQRERELEWLALGTMVKDIGLAAIDEGLITRPGSLSRAEHSVVQSHVEEGLAVLEATSKLPETAVAVVLEHHERFDGSGYPYRVAGEAISPAGRMAAIVDTYDALTSARPYRAAIAPQAALRHLVAGKEFDPALVAAFVHTVGVYPVGTLVMLESGHLAVVDENNPEQSLQPKVRVIYHAGRRQYVTPVLIDLARKVGNHYGQIVRAENFERWGLSAQRWQPA